MSKVVDRATASQVVPEELQNRLMDYAEHINRSSWHIGDVASVLCEENPSRPKWLIDASVAAFVGLSNSRVRDMRACSVFYPDVVRERFEVVSYSHFETAKRAGDLSQAIEWLTMVVDTMDDYGGLIMPVSKLQALMSEKGDIDTTPIYDKRIGMIRSASEKLLWDRVTPPLYRQVAEEILAILRMRGV